MNLKEYYKEILNNLLMTEVTALEKNKPIDVGTAEEPNKAGVQRKVRVDALLKKGNTLTRSVNSNTRAEQLRGERMIHTARAKGVDTEDGFAQREKHARFSNTIRSMGTGSERSWNNDKRTNDQKKRMAANAAPSRASAVLDAKRAPGGDD